MSNLLIVAFTALAVALGGLLGWQGRKFFDRFDDNEKRIDALEEAIEKRALPNRAKDALEDMWAIASDATDQNSNVDKYIEGLTLMLLKSEAARDYQQVSIERLKNIAKTLRIDPRSYDPDQPHGFEDVIEKTSNS